jgi:hypothetical protein
LFRNYIFGCKMCLSLVYAPEDGLICRNILSFVKNLLCLFTFFSNNRFYPYIFSSQKNNVINTCFILILRWLHAVSLSPYNCN